MTNLQISGKLRLIPRNVWIAAAIIGILELIVLHKSLHVENNERTSQKPHSDLYTRNLTLIDIRSFKFIINNDICNVGPVAIVTIVHSSAENKAARDIIRFSSAWEYFHHQNIDRSLSRTTWGSANTSDAVMKLVFTLGEEENISAQGGDLLLVEICPDTVRWWVEIMLLLCLLYINNV